MYFLVKCEKTQKAKVFEKPPAGWKTLEETQGPQEKPKNPRFNRKPQDLGRKPKEW